MADKMPAATHTEKFLPSRKKWLFRIGLILAPLILWVVIECLLSLLIGKERPFHRFQTDRGDIHALNQAYFDQFFLYRLPRMHSLPVTNNRMPIRKGNERRIFCLGGSTTVGYPYNEILEYQCPVSFPRFAETILNDSGLEVRVLNLGCNAFGSREVKRVLADALAFAPAAAT